VEKANTWREANRDTSTQMRAIAISRSLILIVIVGGIAISSVTAKAQTALDPKKFAHTYKDKLTEDEATVLLFCYWCQKSDSDFPISIWPQTIQVANKIPSVELNLHWLHIHQKTGAPYSFTLIDEVIGKKQVPEQWQVKIPTAGLRAPDDTGKSPGYKWKLFMRQSYSQVGIADMYNTGSSSGDASKKGDPSASAKAAILSYAYNQLQRTETWTAQGSLVAAIFLHGDPDHVNDPHLAEVLLTPSVTFDKLTGNGTTQKTDSLVFRLGSLYAIPGLVVSETKETDEKSLLTQFVRLNFTHATDWEFRSQLAGGELEWEPVPIGIKLLPLDRWEQLSGPFLDQFSVLLRGYVHAEGGSVLNPGQKKDLASIPGDYSRAGFHVEASLQPVHFRKLTLSASYEDFESLISGSPSEHLFIAGAQLSLESTGTISLKIQYRNGRLPLTLDKVEDFTVGLGLQF
jgi:hypothetical protein